LVDAIIVNPLKLDLLRVQTPGHIKMSVFSHVLILPFKPILVLLFNGPYDPHLLILNSQICTRALLHAVIFFLISAITVWMPSHNNLIIDKTLVMPIAR